MLKYCKYSLLLLIALLACFIVIFAHNSSVSARDIWVHDEQNFPDSADGGIFNPYSYIQDAIDAAEDGDVIKVKEGTYTEDLYIDKSVSIETDGIDETFLRAVTTRQYTIDIAADSVYFTGFTINDTVTTAHRKSIIHVSDGVEDVRIINTLINHTEGYAIKIDGASLAVIRNNTLNDTRGVHISNSNLISVYNNSIFNCSSDGIRLYESNDNTIGSNEIFNCNYGVYIQSGDNNKINNSNITHNINTGIDIKEGNDNVIEECLITNNSNVGIDIKTSNNIVRKNIFDNNSIGVRVGNSGNQLYENQFYYNTLYGVHCKPDSSSNTIYNNTFVFRISEHALDEGTNKWYYEQLGNYWDDFYGPDPENLNNTVTYNINNVPNVYKYQNNGVDDWYPKGKYHAQPTISEHAPVNWIEYDGRNPPLHVLVNDPDPKPYKSRLTVSYYYLSNNESVHIGTYDNVLNGTNVSMTPIKGYNYKGLGYDFLVAWFVKVKDQYSEITSDMWFFLTEKTPVNNIIPEVYITAEEKYLEQNYISAQIGDKITFNASQSNDTDGKIVFYYWTFGDTESSVNQITPSHTYLSGGTYSCSLICVDDEGGSNMSTIEVKIQDNSNRDPIVFMQAPTQGKIETPLQFNSIGTYDPDNDVMNYTWDFGDGILVHDQESPTHTYNGVGNYTVTLTVIDPNGGIAVEQKNVLISPPTIEDNGLPGFETILVLLTIIGISLIVRKNKSKK